MASIDAMRRAIRQAIRKAIERVSSNPDETAEVSVDMEYLALARIIRGRECWTKVSVDQIRIVCVSAQPPATTD